jgi:hypothetical protein
LRKEVRCRIWTILCVYCDGNGLRRRCVNLHFGMSMFPLHCTASREGEEGSLRICSRQNLVVALNIILYSALISTTLEFLTFSLIKIFEVHNKCFEVS